MNLSQMQYYKQLKGYSLDKLSELSGVPRGTLQKIFSGETKSPRYETLQALEKVLKPKEVSYFDSGDDGAQPPSCVAESTLAYGSWRVGYTLEDYYALPEEQRVELIDGVFYDMSSPSTVHQIVGGDIYFTLKDHIRRKGGNCIPLVAPVDVQLDCDDRTMVQPDVMVLCDKSKLVQRCIMGAPDFVVEVLSRATRKKDATIKLTKYREAGVREYWMVDAEKERVIVYFFEEDELPMIYSGATEIPVRIFGGELKISLADVFESVRDIS